MRRLLEFLFPPRSESAAIARERLKIVLAHERVSQDAPDFLPVLQKELIEVVSRYIEIRPEMIHINLGKAGETSLLEINVELDGGRIKLDKAAAKPAPAREIKPVEPKPALAHAFEPGEPAPWVKPG